MRKRSETRALWPKVVKLHDTDGLSFPLIAERLGLAGRSQARQLYLRAKAAERTPSSAEKRGGRHAS